MITATSTTKTTCEFLDYNPTQRVFQRSECIATTTQPGEVFINNATSTMAGVHNGFTYGEIIISLFLFLIFMSGIFSIFWFGIIKPHIHKIHKK